MKSLFFKTKFCILKDIFNDKNDKKDILLFLNYKSYSDGHLIDVLELPSLNIFELCNWFCQLNLIFILWKK